MSDGFVAGAMIRVKGGLNGDTGTNYVVTRNIDATKIELKGDNAVLGEMNVAGYTIDTVHLIYRPATLSGTPNLSFHVGAAGSPSTLVRHDGGSWIADGFIPGATINVTNPAGGNANDGDFTIDAIANAQTLEISPVPPNFLLDEPGSGGSGGARLRDYCQRRIANAKLCHRRVPYRTRAYGPRLRRQPTVTTESHTLAPLR